MTGLGLRRRHLRFPVFRIPLRWATQNGWVGTYLASGIPVERPFPVRFPSGETFLYEFPEPEGLGESLYWKGSMSTEPDMVPDFIQYARRSSLFVDAGANTGFYSLLAHAANPKIQSRAFEPNPAVFKKLVRHVELNGLANSCQLHAFALGNSTGIVSFQVPEDATMGRIAAPGDDDGGISVEIRRLDDLLAGQAVDLVKIDVEGYELGVLQGMLGILHAHRPVIFFECLPGSPTQEIEALLHGVGYRLHHLRAKTQATPIDHLDPDNRNTHNFLALPR